MSRDHDDDDLPTIGSSDVPVILGLNPYRSAWELWPRLVGLRERYSDSSSSPATRRGHRLEEPVALWWAEEQGLDLVECPKVPDKPLAGPEPWMHDRPDYFGIEAGGGDLAANLVGADVEVLFSPDRVLEIKTTRYLDQWEDGPPPWVLAQALWHLACTTVDTADVVVYCTGTDQLLGWPQQRREDLVQRLVATVRNWYEHHVVEGNPPALDGSRASVRWAGACHPYAAPDTTGMSKAAAKRARPMLEATAADLALHRDLHRVNQQLRALGDQQAQLKAQVMERIGGAYGLQIRGHKLAIWPEMPGKESVNVKALRQFAQSLEPTQRDELLGLIKRGEPYRALRVNRPIEE